MPTQTGTIDLRSGNAIRLYTEQGFSSLDKKYIEQSEIDAKADDILASVRKEIYEVDPETGLPTSEARWESAIDVASRGIRTEVSETYATKDEASITTTATGEAATFDGVATAPLASLVAYGRSVQGGSPTPSAPVEIGSVDSLSIEVSGRNIAYQLEDWYLSSGMTYSSGVITKAAATSTSWLRTSDYVYPAEMFYGRTWTVSFDLRSDDFSDTDGLHSIQINLDASASLRGGRSKYRAVVNASMFPVPTSTWTRHSFTFTPTDESWFTGGSGAAKYAGIGFWSNTKNSWQLRNVQLELGDTASEYEQHQGTTTPIDLQGNELRSLPDGTHDELSVDSAGNVMLTQRVGVATLVGAGNAASEFDTTNGFSLYGAPASFGFAGASNTNFKHNVMCDKLAAVTGNDPNKTNVIYAISNTLIVMNIAGATTLAEARQAITDLGATILYPLASPVSVNLGTIAMPQVSDGSTVWLSASMAVEAAYTAWMPNSEELRSSISQTADGVLATISQSYATKDEVATLVRAYGDGVLVCKRGQTIGALINADGSFDVVSLTWEGDVPKVEVDEQNKVVPLTRIAADGATFGKASGFHMAIETVGEGTSQTQRLGFYDEAGTLVAYMQNGLMYVANTMVLHTMRVGEDDSSTSEIEGWEWKYQTADSATPGNLTLRWVG